MHKRRVLVVSHDFVVPLNQQIYAEVQRLTGWSITLLAPTVWKDEFGNSLRAALLPGFEAELVTAPVWLNGNIVLHSYQFNFRRFLRGREFDLIYVNHEPYAISTAQICRANLQTVKLPFGFLSCQNLKKNYPIPFSWFEQMVYRSSRFAFPRTEAVAEILRQKGFKGDAELFPFPFDPRLYRPLSEPEREEQIPRESDEVVIGYVGRLVEQKGLKTLIEAVGRLPQQRWKLVVIGTGPYEATFNELVRLHGLSDRAKCLGYVAHDVTPRYLAAMDMLVLPSETRPNWKEQFGRVLIEAMACGTCVVGSDSGEIPTLINASGGGRVFPEANPAALADVLLQLINDKSQRESLARVGRTWANDHLSPAAVATAAIGAMEEAIQRKSSEVVSRPGH